MKLPAPRTTRLREDLRDAGLKATGARVAVLRLLRTTGRPLSHAEVSQSDRARSWDKATVYRNLVDLERVGLVRRIQLGDHVWRYQETTGGTDRHEKHPLFVCVECGISVCMCDSRLQTNTPSERIRGFLSGEVEVVVRGICEECS